MLITGAFVWSRTLGGSDGDDVGTSLAADLTSGVLLTGYFKSSSLQMGTSATTLNNVKVGFEDGFVAR